MREIRYGHGIESNQDWGGRRIAFLIMLVREEGERTPKRGFDFVLYLK